MSEYLVTRIAILVFLLAFFIATDLIFENVFIGWTVILLVTTIVGFSHYLVGGYYQLSSFKKLPNQAVAYRWFGILSVASLVCVSVFIITGQLVPFVMLTLGYFMLHGFFNEITLFERGTGRSADRYTVASIALVLFGFSLLAVAHTSSFFTPQLTYMFANDFLLQVYLSNSLYPTIGLWSGAVMIGVSLLVELYALWKATKKTLHVLYGVGLAVAIGVSIVLYPPSYIHLFSALLLYHFLVWFWFYFRQFQRQSTKGLYRYLLLHAVVLVPFLLLFFNTKVATVVDVYVLNSYLFLSLTTVHITVSFMSEKWFKESFLRKIM